jgi:hypothetical protein
LINILIERNDKFFVINSQINIPILEETDCVDTAICTVKCGPEVSICLGYGIFALINTCLNTKTLHAEHSSHSNEVLNPAV